MNSYFRLRQGLAAAYRGHTDWIRAAMELGIDPDNLILQGTSVSVWTSILHAVYTQRKVPALREFAEREQPDFVPLVDKCAQEPLFGNRTANPQHGQTAKATVVEQLLTKLQEEMDHNTQADATIASLRYYYEHKSPDGVVGLQAKLEKANRDHEVDHALEKKELFAKILEKWSLYASAQEIFVHLLARAEFEYNAHVLPLIGQMSEVEINHSITERKRP